ncbi:MAG TPA: glycine zipper 2TM domain-containing protein [Sphingomonas sp.]
MRVLTLALIAATAATTGGCAETYDQPGYASQYSSYRQYDYNRPDPRYNGYYADQYYVDNPRYRERRLSRNDRVYAGRDGRYYCRRSDGTTGLVVGGIAGGALGAALTSGRSEPLGILLGAAAGAAVGSAVDKDNVRCR